MAEHEEQDLLFSKALSDCEGTERTLPNLSRTPSIQYGLKLQSSTPQVHLKRWLYTSYPSKPDLSAIAVVHPGETRPKPEHLGPQEANSGLDQSPGSLLAAPLQTNSDTDDVCSHVTSLSDMTSVSMRSLGGNHQGGELDNSYFHRFSTLHRQVLQKDLMQLKSKTDEMKGKSAKMMERFEELRLKRLQMTSPERSSDKPDVFTEQTIIEIPNKKEFLVPDLPTWGAIEPKPALVPNFSTDGATEPESALVPNFFTGGATDLETTLDQIFPTNIVSNSESSIVPSFSTVIAMDSEPSQVPHFTTGIATEPEPALVPTFTTGGTTGRNTPIPPPRRKSNINKTKTQKSIRRSCPYSMLGKDENLKPLSALNWGKASEGNITPVEEIAQLIASLQKAKKKKAPSRPIHHPAYVYHPSPFSVTNSHLDGAASKSTGITHNGPRTSQTMPGFSSKDGMKMCSSQTTQWSLFEACQTTQKGNLPAHRHAGSVSTLNAKRKFAMKPDNKIYPIAVSPRVAARQPSFKMYDF